MGIKIVLEIFVINLKKDIEKKDYMLELGNNNSLNFSFIDATYGKDLSEDELHKVYAKEKALNYSKRGLALGEIGCALSHKKIYQKIINEKIEVALVLEDDISFDMNLSVILKSLAKLPNDWEVLLLGHHTYSSRHKDTISSKWWKKKFIDKFFISRPAEMGLGTYGYLINLNGAKKLLNELNTIYKPIDHYTGNDKEVNVYMITPSPIKVYDEMSELFHSMSDRKESQSNLTNQNNNLIKKYLKYFKVFNLILFLRDLFRQIKPLKKYTIEKQ